MSDRKRQSLIRLEALGGLSEYYSDVATPRTQLFDPQAPINIDDQDQWDADSVSSERSTTVVIFNKPPPPGAHALKNNTEGRQAHEAVERNGKESQDSIRSRRLRRAHAHKDLGEAFVEEKLKPIKSLNGSRQTPVERPGSAQPTRSTSGNGHESSSRSHNVNIKRPRTAVPPRVTCNYEDQPFSRRVEHSSWLPQQPLQVSEVSELNNDRGSRGRPWTSASTAQSHRRPQKVDPLVDSLGLEVAALTTKCRHPPPTQPPSPCPSLSPSPSSSSSPSREPSPSRGAWYSEHPRQKRPSFIDRAQERMSRSIHEHLVKAGRRPPPSFEVISMSKSPVEDVASWQTKSPMLPPQPQQGGPISAQRRELLEGENAKTSSIPSSISAHRSPAISCATESELFDPEWTAAQSAKSQMAAPGLKIDTQIAELPAAVPVELEAPWHLPSSSSNSAGPALTSDDTADSLFLGPGVAIGSPADASFFASEYAQRAVAIAIAELPADEEVIPQIDDRRSLPSQVRMAEYYRRHQKRQGEVREQKQVSPSLSRKRENRSLKYGEF
ncbi:hypothetical protein F4775DRAFT_590734 [Biscogniauxia sp. FL1348]|nr:hypothetical protein F4775DRAFT_590734 [Biscogniauxia sp. FL1348]